MSNATQNATISSTPTPFTIPTDISSLLNLIYSFAALRDWFKLALIGLALEACRRLYTYGYSSFIDQFFISASFESDDIVYGVFSSIAPSNVTCRLLTVFDEHCRLDAPVAFSASTVARSPGVHRQHLVFRYQLGGRTGRRRRGWRGRGAKAQDSKSQVHTFLHCHLQALVQGSLDEHI